MTIWYISKYASPQKYFFGTRHFYLSEEWVKQGHDVTVITSNSSHLSNALPKFKDKVFVETINQVKTYWLNTFRSKSSSGISRIISWLHFEFQLRTFKKDLKRPDVIIASSLSLLTIYSAWLLSKKYKCKLVFEVRDIWPLSIVVLGNYSRSNLFIKTLSYIERLGYEKSDLVVGTMPNLREHIKEVTQKPVNCITIPQGLNLKFFTDGQTLLQAHYKKKWFLDSKFKICYAGTINVNNSLNEFVAAARLLKNDSDIQFLILGAGSKKAEYMRIAGDLPNVIFPEPVHKSQVNDFLSYVDACYDSFESELARYGLSRNKWIDYMFAAKPIICSYNGYQSMINEARCGEFVPYGNAQKLAEVIQKYAALPKFEIKEIGERGKRFLVDNRTFDKLASEYANAIIKAKNGCAF